MLHLLKPGCRLPATVTRPGAKPADTRTNTLPDRPGAERDTNAPHACTSHTANDGGFTRQPQETVAAFQKVLVDIMLSAAQVACQLGHARLSGLAARHTQARCQKQQVHVVAAPCCVRVSHPAGLHSGASARGHVTMQHATGLGFVSGLMVAVATDQHCTTCQDNSQRYQQHGSPTAESTLAPAQPAATRDKWPPLGQLEPAAGCSCALRAARSTHCAAHEKHA